MSAKSAFSLTNGQRVYVRGEPVFNGDTEWIPISVGNQNGVGSSGKYLKREAQ